MSDITIEIFQKYPLLISNHSFTEWNGYILWSQGHEIPVSISCPKFPSTEEIRVEIMPNPKTVTSDYRTVLQEIISRSNSFLELLDKLEVFVTSLLPNETSPLTTQLQISSKSKLFELANGILAEITDKIGLDVIFALSGDLTKMSLFKLDECNREHRLELKIPANYPKDPPKILSVDVPEVVLAQFSELPLISDFYKTFVSAIQTLQDFWHSCDMLRLNANVVEPRDPMFKDTSWKIAITHDVFASLILNPLDVRSCPVIRVVGNRKDSQEFQAILEKNLKELIWDLDKDVLENLARMLEISSLPPPIEDTENRMPSSQLFQAQECCICFTSRSNDSCVPHKYCNNEKCNSYFHFGCLLEWFQSLPTNDTDSNYISGDCLNCGSKILCPVQQR